MDHRFSYSGLGLPRAILLIIFTTSASLSPVGETILREKYVSGDNDDIVAASQFLHYYDVAASKYCYRETIAMWEYMTNLTEENKKKENEEASVYATFKNNAWKNASSFAWETFRDPLIYKWFKKLSVLGRAVLPQEKLKELNMITSAMEQNYNTAKVCPYGSESGPAQRERLQRMRRSCSMSLEPELNRVFSQSRNTSELAYYWKAWRDVTGKPFRSKYFRMASLKNEDAKLKGFQNAGEMLRERYESDTFLEELKELWQQVQPLYLQLHAYIRRKLTGKYGSDVVTPTGPIPAHLLGDLWALEWQALEDFTRPYTDVPLINVTSAMLKKNVSVLDMVKMAEEFFTSLGLKPMPKSFWENSVFEKPTDREFSCHAGSLDLCNGKDFRIKMCAEVNMDYFVIIHHEMGHIQYFMHYAHQPSVFREAANPGFHEALGDAIALSVANPAHLKAVGLLDKYEDDKSIESNGTFTWASSLLKPTRTAFFFLLRHLCNYSEDQQRQVWYGFLGLSQQKADINFLFTSALRNIAPLPYSYLTDLWRWGVFNGEIRSEEGNRKWWEMRQKYQGVCPPVRRSEEDFDPPSLFHISTNYPYITYFISHIIQFQMHKELCDAAGHKGPLFKCDIYKSEEAGMLLSQLMEAGSTEPWQELMQQLTGCKRNRLDAAPLLEYFAPLLEWLKEQNQAEKIGWDDTDPLECPGRTGINEVLNSSSTTIGIH